MSENHLDHGSRNEDTDIGITLGDPNGIGPEVVLAVLSYGSEISGRCIAYGHREVLASWLERLEGKRDGLSVDLGEVVFREPSVAPPPLELGTPTLESGCSSLAYFENAIEDALAGKIRAVVTAPISKEAWNLAGSSYRGHTKLIQDRCGCSRSVMMLANPQLRVSLVTEHVSLAEVPSLITREAVEETIVITAAGLRDLGVEDPRIAVAGLNPHAGEGGLLGKEEVEVIAPAIARCLEEGVKVCGPLPADTVFHRASSGEFDAVVAMYHDQGLAPLKAISFEDTVNITLGLPVIRTSVGHGTAFGIAGKGIASPKSMLEAVRMAEAMVKNRFRELGPPVRRLD
jgi:4-hydroxythreonine-4-phosphate dehydrogenase